MRIGEALEACARDGALVGRPNWKNWHLRVYDPYLPEGTKENGFANTLHLRECSGWPVPTVWKDPDFSAEAILADDWEILDPLTQIASVEVEIIR